MTNKNTNLNLACERVIFSSWKSLKYALAIKQVPGIIKNTGIVNAGFNKYLIDGFKRGIPPTEAMLIKKNTIPTNIKQKPMEYMSFFLKLRIFPRLLFKKYFGKIADPMKNAINPIRIVITKLVDGGFSDNIKKIANRNKTINGLNRWFFKMLFLFKKLKKFSSGYKLLK